MLKERYNNLKIKFEKHIRKKKLDQTLEEFMKEENNQIIIHPIETCNNNLKKIKAPQIECTKRI